MERTTKIKRRRKSRSSATSSPVSMEYLTISKAAQFMGCTRQYVYKLISTGKLKAFRLSSRMAVVKVSDIHAMFDDSPYCTVRNMKSVRKAKVMPVPTPENRKQTTSKFTDSEHKQEYAPKKTRNQKSKPVQINVSAFRHEPVEYIPARELMENYGICPGFLSLISGRNGISVRNIKEKTYYDKRHTLLCLGPVCKNTETLLTAEQMAERFSLTMDTFKRTVSRYKIPFKVHKGTRIYSTTYFHIALGSSVVGNERCMSLHDISGKYEIRESRFKKAAMSIGIPSVIIDDTLYYLKEDVEKLFPHIREQ